GLRVLALTQSRLISTETEEDDAEAEEVEPIPQQQIGETERALDPKDRSRIVAPETSIRYMKSKAYTDTYGCDPVWKSYRRNHKGHIPPSKTRQTCIRGKGITTGNPCPACRDEFLVLHYTNNRLLEQFICPYTGEVLPPSKTGLCQRKQRELLIAVEKAKDYGLLEFTVPFREYDYIDYYPQLKDKTNS
ncbi:PREDICTED: 28S ribosomal protein S18b, mitochondrial-like, partial [Priapulus caudatus]|uniref:Small ribosomal subunit protein mS40 n=1 Tax=Priapulus caudatus TaxID=37621 RepID=A0ABM1ESJ2_PRICU